MNRFLTLSIIFATVLTGQAQTFASAASPALALHITNNPTEPAQPTTYQMGGCVYGPDGLPLPGATLLVKGTTQVVSTDANGHFTLALPARTANILVAGYAGCEDATLTLDPNQNRLQVYMRSLLPTGFDHALRVGDLAPDFNLPTTTGTTFKLREHRGHPVVLYFYPKDGSSGCTKEACSFRDQYQDFKALGAEVIGISSDDESSHREFTAKYELPFPLLSDEGGQLRKQYAVPRAAWGLLPGRVTYVLDAEGRVRYVFNSLNEATNHVLNAKNILRGL
jgi:peroxiredoxin